MAGVAEEPNGRSQRFKLPSTIFLLFPEQRKIEYDPSNGVVEAPPVNPAGLAVIVFH
jgi:hypothetical protein